MRLRVTALILLTLTLTLGLIAVPMPVEAQKPEQLYRIAIFAPSMLPELLAGQVWSKGTLEVHTTLASLCSAPALARAAPRGLADTIADGLCQGLHALGYELANFHVLYAFEESLRRPSHLSTELVHSKVDLILAGGTRAALAAKEATRTIPVIFVEVPDPVAVGLVGSLARPGANITGVSSLLAELGTKQLELLKEAAPNVSRVAILHDPTDAGASLEPMRVAASALGLSLQPLKVRGPSDLEPAFAAIPRADANAILVMPGHSLWPFKSWIADRVTQSNLPTMFWSNEFVEMGGLMAYGPDLPHVGRRAASMVDRILKGANPGHLPVEQPTKFELVINLKTAKALGLTIPPSVLVRADRIIE